MWRKWKLAFVGGLIAVLLGVVAGVYHLQASGEKSPSPKPPLPSVPPPPPGPAANPTAAANSPPLAPVAQHPAAPVPVPLPESPRADSILAGLPQGPSTPAPAKDFLWTLKIDTEQGKTVLIAKAKKKDVEFRVSCDNLNLQAPAGSIQASSRVTITAPNLEAKTHRLTINLHDDQLVLEGPTVVKQKRHGQELELQAERLSLRLTVHALEEEPVKEDLK